MNPADLIPLITGTAGALVLSCVGLWYQAKEKRYLQDIIKGKDDDLKTLTRESIAGITTLAGINNANQEWQKATTAKLDSIKDALP